MHFENTATEAAAAAMLAASVQLSRPRRGDIQVPVGINVASDAIANLASGGVTGGALIIIGEDYGEGSSIMQERTHAYAMKSQMWLLDPRPEPALDRQSGGRRFRLSEASHTPVMLEAPDPSLSRARPVHRQKQQRPNFALREAMENPARDTERIVLPPAAYLHEREKIEQRWPAAVKFIKERGLNEFFGRQSADVGIIVQGGLYNTVMRSLQRSARRRLRRNQRAHLRAQRHLPAHRRRDRRVSAPARKPS